MPTLLPRLNLAVPLPLWMRLRPIPGKDGTNVVAIVWAALRLVDEQLSAKPRNELTEYERDLVKVARAIAYKCELPKQGEKSENGKLDNEAWF